MSIRRQLLVVWAGFTALALFLATGNSLTYMADGRPGRWGLSISLQLAEWWMWALLTPLVVWLSRRWPVDRFAGRAIVVHLCAGLSLAFLKTATDRLVRGSIIGVTPYFLLSTVTFQFTIYCVIVTVVHAVDGRRRERERERAATQLETRLARTRLELLRAQLHPHFLFNTLNAIAELVHENPATADRMISGLGDLFRQASGSAERIPLADELDLVRKYVDIQRGRFGDHVRLVVETDADAERARVPTLILQPLVENAFRHGLAADRPGLISVRASRRGPRLHIEVIDDGTGLPSAGLREGVGLGNTRARLETTYGADHRFHVSGGERQGVRAALDLPFETDGGQ